MNDAHLHLIFNHLPIIIPAVGIFVMLIGYIFKSNEAKRIALNIFILGALCTLPAFFTGEGAEEVIEDLNGVSHKLIHQHEEFAETFAILSYVLGFIALIALWAHFKKKSFANILTLAVLVFSLVVLFFAQKTGTTGGEIRHSEIREAGSES